MTIAHPVPVLLDLPGPSRRIRVEPLEPPRPLPAPEREREAAPAPSPSPPSEQPVEEPVAP